jgi:hypothetical protein
LISISLLIVCNMKLHIDDKRSFQYVQYEFGERYPFLKIDFLRPCIRDEKPLLRKQRVEGTINIEGRRTVDQIVKDFEEVFGFSMIVLRRSGKVWIETSLTTDWTLEQQNREGENISRID